MNNVLWILSLLVVILPAGYINQSSHLKETNLIYNDHIYDPGIKSVEIYNQNSGQGPVIDNAVSSLRQNSPFILEFDEINEDARYYQAKIVYCNWDWTPADVHSIEYMNTYNEIDYQSYTYSMNSKIPYTHYKFILPPVKLAGNYLVYVYDRDNPDRILLSRRFMIFDPTVVISPKPGMSSSIPLRSTHQQIDFSISYNGLNLLNPAGDLKVVIRKNFSWHNAISGLHPTEIDDQNKLLSYTQFNLENNFPGGNEYRYFDMESNVTTGRNVDRIVNSADRIDAFLGIDKPRSGQAYGKWQDMDGAYYISTIDGNDASTEANYMYTHFFLKTDVKLNSKVYLFGGISLRQLLPEYEMKYDSGLGGYTGNFLLKEGYYEYLYVTSGNDEYQIEGNHYETENTYDITVYYRPPSRIYDYIVGYAQFKCNLD